MLHVLMILWCLSFSILTVYHMAVFRIRKVDSGDQQGQLPGVSIVIAVKNGSDRLIHHLKSILNQEYHLFEIIIVDDHSDANEKSKLEDFAKHHSNISFYRNEGLPGKKQALRFGIEKAQHELILCTDADCQPSTSGWIKSMVSKSAGSAMVLGYSPYTQARGLLNLFVRFETLMTGMQYLSWAMAGKAYMGVGRNMLYPKNLFLQADPYKDHQGMPYGDDDLWVQKAATLTKIHVNLDEASFVCSDPPRTWLSWFKQKHRHLSAGHHYKSNVWWQPGLFGLALIVHWFFLPVLVYVSWMNWIGLLFFAGLLMRWMVYAKWTTQLGEKDTVTWYPLLETGYALYLAVVGMYTLVAKKKTWN